jgi:hypothetical protein
MQLHVANTPMGTRVRMSALQQDLLQQKSGIRNYQEVKK